MKTTQISKNYYSLSIVWIKRFFQWAEITRATVYGILTIGLRFLVGPFTALLIIMFFSSELQGYYYTFNSILALQIFVEMGFSNIVTYFAGHEWARLHINSEGRISGDADALSRLISLGRAVFRWYSMCGLIVAVGIGTGGWVFFYQSTDVGIVWKAPWFFLSTLTGINLILLPVWSLLEGCNQVAQVYFFRFVGSIVTILATLASIYFGAGLWTASISLSALLFWSGIFLLSRYRLFFRPFFLAPEGPRISWLSEIWQVQWRTALVYMSNYFSYQMFTVVMFHFHGPVEAGKFGMTWSIVYACVSVATMLSIPRGPQFAVMIARREYKAIDRLLYRITVTTTIVMLIGIIAVWLVVYGLNVLNHPFVTRLLPPLPTALLLIGMGVVHLLHPTTVYLRAHKKEPYVLAHTANALLTGILTLLLVKPFAAIGIAIVYLSSNLIQFVWRLLIFMRCRTEWRKETDI